MFKNYLKTAWRNLSRNKIYSAINIVGLTIGLTACLLVATVVIDDLSYDRQWANADHIYRIVTVDRANKNATRRFPQSMTGLGPTMMQVFPEVKNYCRMANGDERLRFGDEKDGVKLRTLDAEPTMWSFLDFKVTEGNPHKYVDGYRNLVITEKVRKQYFGNTDPVGKVISNIPSFGELHKFLITGVIKDIPNNSHLRADVIVLNKWRPGDDVLHKEGYGTFYQQYLLISPGANAAAFSQKMSNWYNQKIMQVKNKPTTSFELQPMKDIYLKSDNLSGAQTVIGSMRNVYIFSGVALMLLLIACINFVNLTISRILKRMPEVGVRKVLGAGRRQIVMQFLFESLLFFTISFSAGMLLYSLFLSPLENYLDHKLTLTLHSNLWLLLATTLVVLSVSVITGVYPALILSSQKPSATLKGKSKISTGGNVLRKGLVVVQFAISIIILVCTLIVHNQIGFMDNKDLGYNKSHLLLLDDNTWGERAGVFKQQVVMLPGIKSASFSGWYPGSGGAGNMGVTVPDPHHKDSKLEISYITADIDFARTLGLQLQKGRMLDPALASDALNADSLMNKDFNQYIDATKMQPILVTASTASMLDIDKLDRKYPPYEGIPVGILKDFNSESLHERIKPTFIRAWDKMQYGAMLIRVQPGTEKQVLTGINKVWQSIYPDKVFQFKWIDELVDKQYQTEHNLQQLFTLFSGLILFLACLGLLGLTIFNAELRIKEIGIRKVLGASVTGIAVMLSKDFVRLILLAILIASPVAWFAMNKWLEGFAYRIQIQWWVFLAAGVSAIFVAAATISYQAVKAASANPVKSLRSE